jgi:hypothetical protein
MAGVTRIPRRRGSLCGLLLILLGAWGALVPFVGPYFKFAFTPDKAWAYNSGRLYLSIVPGAAAVLGGLLVLATRNRAVGMFGGLLAAAGGAWFIAGQPIVAIALKRPSITAGVPVTRGGATVTGSTTIWQFLEMLGFFTAVGILIVFLGALALGRFSMVSARDMVEETTYGDDYLDPADDGQPQPAAVDQYAATSTHTYPLGEPRPFPGEEPTQTQDRFPPATTGQFPSPTGQFPASSATQFPSPRGPFEPGSSTE